MVNVQTIQGLGLAEMMILKPNMGVRISIYNNWLWAIPYIRNLSCCCTTLFGCPILAVHVKPHRQDTFFSFHSAQMLKCLQRKA